MIKEEAMVIMKRVMMMIEGEMMTSEHVSGRGVMKRATGL